MGVVDYNAMLPQRISRIIDERGFKQRAIAQRAGFSPQQFTDMLNGRRIIKACDVLAVADALGVEVGELFIEEDPGDRASQGMRE